MSAPPASVSGRRSSSLGMVWTLVDGLVLAADGHHPAGSINSGLLFRTLFTGADNPGCEGRRVRQLWTAALSIAGI